MHLWDQAILITNILKVRHKWDGSVYSNIFQCDLFLELSSCVAFSYLAATLGAITLCIIYSLMMFCWHWV